MLLHRLSYTSDTRKSFESRHEPKGLPPEIGIDLSASGLFTAVYELDKDKVEVILKSGKIDVNSNWCFGKTSVSGGQMSTCFKVSPLRTVVR